MRGSPQHLGRRLAVLRLTNQQERANAYGARQGPALTRNLLVRLCGGSWRPWAAVHRSPGPWLYKVAREPRVFHGGRSHAPAAPFD